MDRENGQWYEPNFTQGYGREGYRNDRLQQLERQMYEDDQRRYDPRNARSQQQLPQSPQRPARFITYPVTSVEEAKAAMINDTDIFIFTNFGNDEMYVKRIVSGEARFFEFQAKTPPPPPQPEPSPREVYSALMGKFSDLEYRVQEIEKGGFLNEQTATVPIPNAGTASEATTARAVPRATKRKGSASAKDNATATTEPSESY